MTAREDPDLADAGSLRVLFEATWWEEGPPSLRRVLRESILAWRRLYPADDLVLVVPRAARLTAEAELGQAVTVRTTSLRPQAFAAMFGTIGPSAMLRPDVVFTQNFTSLAPRVPKVVLIHDLMFCEHPNWFTKAENAYFSLMPLTARFASVVLATSSTESRRISRYLNRQDVTPVGLGLSSDLKRLTPDPPERPVLPGLESGQFVLSVGRLNARKNLVATIEGALAADILRTDFPLVVVGSPDGLQDSLPPTVREAIDKGLVRYTGFVDDEKLVWLYGNCRFFSFLSLDEGYGLPPLEALHFGAPVLASDRPIFRELLGGLPNIHFCEPTEVAAISASMTTLAKSKTSQTLSPNSIVADRYTWDAVVARMRAAAVRVSRRRAGSA